MSKKKNDGDRRSGWILPYLTMYGAGIDKSRAPEDQQTVAMLRISKLAHEAFDRIKSPNYEALYEGEGWDVQNLFAEAFCEGMEAGLKAADIIVKTEEEK